MSHCRYRSRSLYLRWEKWGGVYKRKKQKLFPKDVFEFEVTPEHTVKMYVFKDRGRDGHVSQRGGSLRCRRWDHLCRDASWRQGTS